MLQAAEFNGNHPANSMLLFITGRCCYFVSVHTNTLRMNLLHQVSLCLDFRTSTTFMNTPMAWMHSLTVSGLPLPRDGKRSDNLQ